CARPRHRQQESEDRESKAATRTRPCEKREPHQGPPLYPFFGSRAEATPPRVARRSIGCFFVLLVLRRLLCLRLRSANHPHLVRLGLRFHRRRGLGHRLRLTTHACGSSARGSRRRRAAQHLARAQSRQAQRVLILRVTERQVDLALVHPVRQLLGADGIHEQRHRLHVRRLVLLLLL